MEDVKTDFKDYHIYNAFGPTTHSKGCTILVRKNMCIEYNVINDIIDEESWRFVLLNIDFSGTVFTFVNIYAPNDKRCRNNFFELVNNKIEEESLGLKIIGGDFNDVLNETDRYTHSNSRTKTSEKLKI